MRVFHLLHSDHALNNVALSRIKIARIADLNDPFELLAANLGNNKELRKAIRGWRTELNKTHGLLCFSKDWRNPVLWSHYGDKHRGICLGFDLDDELVENVRYVDTRLPPRLRETQKGKFSFDEPFVREMLRTKFLHWIYEAEVRVFLSLDPETAERGIYFYPFSDQLKLREVILGPLCEVPISRVRALVEKTYTNVLVLKARLAFKFFSVVPDERSITQKYVFPDQSIIEPAKEI